MDALTARDHVIACLSDLDVDITDGAPETGRDGRVRRTVIVTIDTGTVRDRRATGDTVHAVRTVTCMAVTASRDSCLWLTDAVVDRLDGTRVGADVLRDVSYSGEPIQEPSTSPARWSKTLAFTCTTTRRHR